MSGISSDDVEYDDLHRTVASGHGDSDVPMVHAPHIAGGGPSSADATRTAALTVLLAEFASVRTTIDRKATSALTLISLNATAIAAIAGLVLADKADIRLLLVVPVLSSTLGLMVFDEQRDIGVARRYIIRTLQPLTSEHSGDLRVLRYAEGTRNSAFYVVAVQAVPFALLFPAVSGIALAAVVPHLTSVVDWCAFGVGATLTLMLTMVWLSRVAGMVRASREPD